jgi:hypothetical protein
MYLGDKGRPSKFTSVRYNYDVLIDNERMTLSKIARNLGFYSVIYSGKIKNIETVYDTDKNLLTGAGLLIRKRQTPQRTYFVLVRISDVKNVSTREKKAFLGECESKDQPSDFPVQIADGINNVFNNLFSINVVDIVKHCTAYIVTEITGNLYKIVSGTGYEAQMSFETLKARDVRTGKKVKLRNFSISFRLDPAYEKEREHILQVVDRYCKELVPLNLNRFEIAEVALHPRTPTTKTKFYDDENGEIMPPQAKKDKKKGKEKRSN